MKHEAKGYLVTDLNKRVMNLGLGSFCVTETCLMQTPESCANSVNFYKLLQVQFS